MKSKRLLPVAALTAFLFIGTACTDGGFLDQTRLTFRAVDNELTQTPASAISFGNLTVSGDEVMATAAGGAGGLSIDRLVHSADSGRSWATARFDGQEDPRGRVAMLARSTDAWMVLVSRNSELIPFLSADGKDFRQAGDGFAVPPGGSPLEFSFVRDEWTVLTGGKGAEGLRLQVFRSKDGTAWTETASPPGLPYGNPGLNIVSGAAGDNTLLLAGQSEAEHPQGGTRIRAAAFASEDGGLSWTDVSPDASGIAPYNDGLRSAAWDGQRFRLSGFGWPETNQGIEPQGLQASWAPGQSWDLAMDPSWAAGTTYFPSGSTASASATFQVASQFIGDNGIGSSRLLIQQPGQPWKVVPLPPEAPKNHTSIQDTAVVSDGALAAASVTDKGNTQEKIWHVDPAGTITDRTPVLPKMPSGPIRVAGIAAAEGGIKVFGNSGSQPAIWESDGGRDFSDVTTLTPDGNQNLRGFHSAHRSDIVFGTDVSQSNARSVIWSRRDGGKWEAFSGDVFSGRTSGSTPIQAALVTDTGFVVAGQSFSLEDGGGSAAVAVSTDGKAWDRVEDPSFAGSIENSRSIEALVRTTAGTTLAGGYVETARKNAPTVWMSQDHQGWTPVTLELPAGQDDARVTSLTTGPAGVVAIVGAYQPGTGHVYTAYVSADEGKTWTPGTALPAPAEGQTMAEPHVTATENGYVLLATHGAPGEHKALMMVSSNGKDFTAKDIDHGALNAQDLALSDIEAVNGKLLVAGLSGPIESRKSFAFEVDVPILEL
ncbi:sialidase family protein [Pseudarthrobacter sp. J64]|uniref:sialidase family protein n=1 Tax=Pseudarthrobacter sp. J64 TaxID=3116485 RepID=UPI002E7FCD94|nr:sialidase family protein [Pseudarthrobacter sp. J64]MEE2569233.1 sialidase family protein [Pseudarthrobacter sp. J64]